VSNPYMLEEHHFAVCLKLLISIFIATLHIWKLSSLTPTQRHAILWWKSKRKIIGLISLLLSKNTVITTTLKCFWFSLHM
jgi:hypothetical protein